MKKGGRCAGVVLATTVALHVAVALEAVVLAFLMVTLAVNVPGVYVVGLVFWVVVPLIPGPLHAYVYGAVPPVAVEDHTILEPVTVPLQVATGCVDALATSTEDASTAIQTATPTNGTSVFLSIRIR